MERFYQVVFQFEGIFPKVGIRIAGGMAVFLILYFFNPAMPDSTTTMTINGNNGTQINEVSSGGVVHIGPSSTASKEAKDK